MPVKLSDHLVTDARLTGDALSRSIAGQVEHWASLGRAVELILNGDQLLALAKRGKRIPVSRALEIVNDTQGQEHLQRVLQARPFPHYEEHTDGDGRLVRIEADGSRTIGRFINRKFVPQE